MKKEVAVRTIRARINNYLRWAADQSTPDGERTRYRDMATGAYLLACDLGIDGSLSATTRARLEAAQ